ncbi:unnamed protein product [Boreogadus saida]
MSINTDGDRGMEIHSRCLFWPRTKMLALPPNETMQRRGLESLESPNPEIQGRRKSPLEVVHEASAESSEEPVFPTAEACDSSWLSLSDNTTSQSTVPSQKPLGWGSPQWSLLVRCQKAGGMAESCAGQALGAGLQQQAEDLRRQLSSIIWPQRFVRVVPRQAAGFCEKTGNLLALIPLTML